MDFSAFHVTDVVHFCTSTSTHSLIVYYSVIYLHLKPFNWIKKQVFFKKKFCLVGFPIHVLVSLTQYHL